MKNTDKIKYYSPTEEKLNIISHAIGFCLSIVGFVFLISISIFNGNIRYFVSSGIFGASLIILFASSTIYHSSTKPELRIRLRILDHASIYVLIAGTYTPFALITLHGTVGWTIFSISWGLAIIGIILKFFFTGKFRILSTIMYVLMGWIIIFAIKPLINNLSTEGLYWLFTGGIFYTVGAILYAIKGIKFNHAIFHIFVLFGAFCHSRSASADFSGNPYK